MTTSGQPLSVYPIWKSDGTPYQQITQGNQSDNTNDISNTHHGSLQWAYDFGTSIGTPVHAVANGVVEDMNMAVPGGRGYGNVITIKSTDASGKTYYTTYAHLSSSSLHSGDSVTAGQVIAQSGEELGAAHLHIQFGSALYSPNLINGNSNYRARVADGIGDTIAPAYFPALVMGWDAAHDPNHLNATDRVYNGTEGNDLFYGNDNGDTVHGGDGDNLIGNILIGGNADDTLDALRSDGTNGSGRDTFQGNGGHNVITGGTGINTAVYSGRAVDYNWRKNSDGSWTVTRPDGTDILRNIQYLRFLSGGDLFSSRGDVIALSPTVAGQLITLNDATMAAHGDVSVVNTYQTTVYQNGIPVGQATLSYNGPVTSNGFVLTNLNRTDFAFHSWDQAWASLFGYFYDGVHALGIPQNGNYVGGVTNYSGTDTIQITKQDKTTFSMKSVGLDTYYVESGAVATFIGIKADGTIVSQTFQLDATANFQTFSFNSSFTNLMTVDFTATDSILFDNLTFDPSPPTVAITSVSPRGSSGSSTADGADTYAGSASVLTVSGIAVGNSMVTLFDNGMELGTSSADGNGIWSFGASLTNGTHTLTANDTVGTNTSPLSSEVSVAIGPNPMPVGGTAADMILRRGDGTYEIYDIGNNAILGGFQLGQVGTDWQFVGLGGFFGSDTADMLLRSATTGGFEVYDISNNNITGAAVLGTVGMDWQVMGFGDFSSLGENDMILRNVNSGGIEVYDISNNQITGAAFMGTVGLNWQIAGFSSHGTETDMILRNSGTGGLEIYDINNDQITGASFLGAVGLDWQVSGFGDFSTSNEGDMLLRNKNTGGLELYDISNNQITAAFFLGNVGLEWQFAGIAPIHGPGASDLVLRNVNTGAFEVYDIANNQLTGAASLGAVGLDWQLGGFAADPPTASTGSMGGSSQSAQLVQAIAGFGGGSGAAEGVNAVPLGADTSQQLLTTPQHA
jgi:murein DD-endopeptidase MepM/ murein hydrolase activator NlpD